MGTDQGPSIYPLEFNFAVAKIVILILKDHFVKKHVANLKKMILLLKFIFANFGNGVLSCWQHKIYRQSPIFIKSH